MLSGKRVAEGGVSSLGLDPGVGKPLVGLFCVTRAELQTSSVCGGKIGQAGRMCVVKECGVSGHMTNNLSDQFSRGPSTEELCFIYATERSVYEDPVLSTVKFGQGREDILQVKKTQSEWQSLFSILSRADVPEAEGLADVQRRLALGEQDIGMTPRKKTRFASDPADVLDVQVYALPELETLEQALPTLLEAWPAVRANFSTLHSSDVAQQEAVLTLRVDLVTTLMRWSRRSVG
jgi:hypothetical protein